MDTNFKQAMLDCDLCDSRKCHNISTAQLGVLSRTGSAEIFCDICRRTTWWRYARYDRRATRDRRSVSGIPPAFLTERSMEETSPQLAGVQSLAGDIGFSGVDRAASNRRAEQQRDHRRLPLAMPVRIRAQQADGFEEATLTINICRGGICIQSDKPYQKDMLLSVAMNEADLAFGTALEQKARVVRVDRSPCRSSYAVAIQFIN